MMKKDEKQSQGRGDSIENSSSTYQNPSNNTSSNDDSNPLNRPGPGATDNDNRENKRAKRNDGYLQYRGRRGPRIGDDFQATPLPLPHPLSSSSSSARIDSQ